MPRLAALQCRLFMLVAAITVVVIAPGEATPHMSEFVYALRQEDGGTNQIYGFEIGALGGLTPLPGFPMGSGGTGSSLFVPQQMAAVNGRLYVLNDGSDTLSGFTVNRSTGALTPLPFSPIALDVGSWTCVAAHPSGSPVVVGSPNVGLASFVITATTATVAPGSPFTTGGASPFSCAFSRDGSVVYAGGNSNAFIAGSTVATGTGVLTALPGSPFNSGSLPGSYATDSTGRLFSANRFAGQIRVYTTAGGVPTGVTLNPFPSGLSNAVHGLLHPAGYYLVADRNAHRVGVFRITGNGAGTILSPVLGSPFPAGGIAPNVLTLTHDGLNLVVAMGASRTLSVLRVDKNSGDLQFLLTQAADTLGATGVITGLASVPRPILGDVDGDLHADIFWRNKVNGQNVGWLMNGAMAIDSGSYPTITPNWQLKGVGDFDANSRADVIWRHQVNGTNILWRMNGLSLAASTFLPTIADTNWDITGLGDFDASGTADVIWRHKVTGNNIAWLMDGASVALAAFLPTIADTNWEIAGAGDFDRDGKADVIWRHKVTGQNIAWLMNGASIAFSAFLPTIADTNWEIKGVGDLNADGKADVVWRIKTDGHNAAWLMSGATVASSAFLPSIEDLNWEIKSMRDLDGDTRADLVWRNTATGQNMVWLMNGFSTKATAFLPTIADLNWEIVGQ